jgi:hypothetical protein
MNTTPFGHIPFANILSATRSFNLPKGQWKKVSLKAVLSSAPGVPGVGGKCRLLYKIGQMRICPDLTISPFIISPSGQLFVL